jgi:phosphate starvation-inducible protein PhoH and related proteins
MGRPTKKKSKYQEKTELHLKTIRPKTERQAEYLGCLLSAPQTIVMGPAGTGKTYLSAAVAANQLISKRIEKIVLTRPNVAAGRALGFLPGTMEEKIGPWVVPFTDVIRQYMGDGAFEVAMKNGTIDIVPFEIMRGRTFNDAFIILDEAQNTSPQEIKMFLTRIGENSTVVVNGDVKQSDLKATSGLTTVIKMIKKLELPIPIVEFTVDDIVRSDICAMWIRAFDKEGI